MFLSFRIKQKKTFIKIQDFCDHWSKINTTRKQKEPTNHQQHHQLCHQLLSTTTLHCTWVRLFSFTSVASTPWRTNDTYVLIQGHLQLCQCQCQCQCRLQGKICYLVICWFFVWWFWSHRMMYYNHIWSYKFWTMFYSGKRKKHVFFSVFIQKKKTFILS